MADPAPIRLPVEQAVALRQALQAQALLLGFDLFGVTAPDPPPHFPVFQSWLAAGRHGEMGYLASERSLQRRADPRRILPECGSILVLGVRYSAPPSLFSDKNLQKQPIGGADRSERAAPLQPDSPVTGKVAAYAWGDDYHDLLPPRLARLVEFIQTELGAPVPARWYTDTGPLLERDLAQRAGLGWIGKNTCLIHPRLGSYLLLAEILLGVDLPPDPPFEADRCGSCTRCLEACPTGCILPDRTLDARECLSYLTIELKGAIPRALRPRLGGWIFGCDICQQVCPWNGRFARSSSNPAIAPVFVPRPDLPSPDLRQELSLTGTEFNLKFKGSPIQRARRRGYLRNAAVALGSGASPAALPALAGALQGDPEPLVRSHAAWALGQLGGPEAEALLLQAALLETDADVLAEVYAAASRFSVD